MGTFFAAVQVSNRDDSEHLEEVEALVDTGSSDSVFPASLLERLNIQPRGPRTVILADGSETEYQRGFAWLSIHDREGACPVLFGPEGDENSLIGATTLQILMLTVDPVAEELRPARALRMGWGGPL